MTTRRSRAVLLPGLLALAMVAAACGSDDASSADRQHRHRGAATARRPTPVRPREPVAGRPRVRSTRSVSSTSARRTTSATTRPPTRAARRCRSVPRRRGAPGRERAGDRRVRSRHAGHDRRRRRPHLRHQLRPPRVRRQPGRGEPRGRVRPSGRPRAGAARQPRHLLRHRVRAGLPGRHRRRCGQRDRHARLRLRLPDPADAGEHQRLHARCAVGEPRHRDDHGVDRELVRPRPAGPGRTEPRSTKAPT